MRQVLPTPGETLYRVDYRNRFNPDAELTAVTVTKVSRTYIYAGTDRFSVHTWESAPYPPGYILVESLDSLRKYQKRWKLAKVCSGLSVQVWARLSETQLQEIIDTLNKGQQ